MSDKNDAPTKFDPDATVSGPLAGPDPDATVSQIVPPPTGKPELKIHPALKDSDPEATLNPALQAVDPEATFNGPMAQFDPDATINSSGSIRRRSNPFAPKALPEALQANLAALGGLNQLIAFANPILSAIPQIGVARNHPDPVRLKETLQDLVEAFEAGAGKAGVGDETLEGAVYALCCLADDAAAATPWGRDWPKEGLLHEMRAETDGGEQFFALVESARQKPEDNADLLEFLYICLALGFQGRYRRTDGGAADPVLAKIRSDLHALVTRRRPRPSGLSAQWRPAAAGSVRAPASAVTNSAGTGGAIPWRTVAAAAFALVVLVAGYRIFSPAPPIVADGSPLVSGAGPAAKLAPPVAEPVVVKTSAPAVTLGQSVEKALAAEIERGAVAVSEKAGRAIVTLRIDRQFDSGSVAPSAEAQAMIGRVGGALAGVPGQIVVRGYADSVPPKPGTAYASNLDLSAARAKAAAALIAARVGQQRVASEGAGEADPIAPNDTEENRARNRRVSIVLGPKT